MENLMFSLSGIGSFALYFLASILLMSLFVFIYVRITPYDEWKLIKKNNSAAALALSGSTIGYCLAISSAASSSVNILDFLIWGGIALLAQIIAFFIVKIIFLPALAKRIENNDLSAGIVLAAVSVSVGLLNAACMSY